MIFNKFEVSVKTSKVCPFCGHEVDTTQFRDELSVKEFHISGLCQNCQDEVFGNSPCSDCNKENCINCDSL